MSIDINGDIEKIKALEDNILEQYNKNVELEKKMEQETEKFAKQANTAIEDYNSNAEVKTDNFNANAEAKTDDFDNNATEKKSEITDIAEGVKNMATAIQTEMENKKDGFDENVEEKTNTFNSNVETKTTEFNNNSNTKTEEFNNNSTEKINAFNSNAEKKITDYNEHVETLTSRIADLEEETDDLFNALDTEKISGTELYIEDAKPCRVINAGINGMYKQKTTTGANILDISDMLFGNSSLEQNGLKATLNNDSSITINGTATKTTYLKKSLKSVLEDGNYYFYNFNNIKQANETYYMLIQGRKSTGYTSADYYNVRGYQANNFIKDTETYDASFDCLFVFKEGFVANNLNLYPIISKTAQTGFEPYTGKIPSPNPNYPQKIEQVESVNLNINNKNLLNPIFTVNSNCTIENQTITSTALLAQTVQFIRFGFPKIKLRKGIKYYISFRAKKINTNYAGGFNQVQLFTADNKKFINFSAIVNPNLNANYQRYNFVSANITEEQSLLDYVKILVQRKSIAEDLVFAITDVMVTKENTEYTAYQNQTINIDLKGNKLCAVSDTIKDKLLIDRSGNVALQKNVNYSTFSAFNSINGSFTKSTQFILNISNCVKNVEQNSFNALSNCMLKNTTDGGMGFYGTTTSGNVRITVLNSLLNVTQEDTTSTKLNAAKTFLQNLQQTPEIYYPAEVPALIDLGQLPELLKTFNGINNVWAETNLGNTEIEIKYVQDVKKILEQQNARLDNIEALLSTTETSALLLDNMQNDLEKEVE